MGTFVPTYGATQGHRTLRLALGRDRIYITFAASKWLRDRSHFGVNAMGLPIAFVVTGGEVTDYKRQRPCAKALDFPLSSELIYRLSKSDGFLSKAVIAAFRIYVIKRVYEDKALEFVRKIARR